jgi:hypothetical protein
VDAMPYVQRNQVGIIVSLTALPVSEKDQFMHPDDPEIINFLSHPIVVDNPRDKAGMELFAADLAMIRVVEDLIDLLTAKGLIMFSDLPAAVQEKILSKRTVREQYISSDILVDDLKLL